MLASVPSGGGMSSEGVPVPAAAAPSLPLTACSTDSPSSLSSPSSSSEQYKKKRSSTVADVNARAEKQVIYEFQMLSV